MNDLLNRVLPRRIDNTYRGHPVALWLFGAVVAVKTGIALGTMFNGRGMRLFGRPWPETVADATACAASSTPRPRR
jgi:hypothetical protein